MKNAQSKQISQLRLVASLPFRPFVAHAVFHIFFFVALLALEQMSLTWLASVRDLHRCASFRNYFLFLFLRLHRGIFTW